MRAKGTEPQKFAPFRSLHSQQMASPAEDEPTVFHPGGEGARTGVGASRSAIHGGRPVIRARGSRRRRLPRVLLGLLAQSTLQDRPLAVELGHRRLSL